MTYGVDPYGVSTYGSAGGGTAAPSGEQATLDIQSDIVGATEYAWAWVRQAIYSNGIAPSIDIQQAIQHATITPTLSVTSEIHGGVQPTLSITSSVRNLSGKSDLWKLELVLGGVDRTSRISGDVRISHEEDASSIATFDLVMGVGVFDADTWTGQQVIIDYIAVDTAGVEQWRARRFTGIVSTPTLNTDTGVAQMMCTTDNQRRVYYMGNDEIDAFIGGKWSRHVFDEDQTPWERAQDRLSTIQASLFADVNGILKVSSWTPNISANIDIVDSNRLEDTLRSQKADRNSLVNAVYIDFGFRYSRFRQRTMALSWVHPSYCEYAQWPWYLCSKDSILQAASGSSWELIGDPLFEDLWPRGEYYCVFASGGTNVGWLTEDEVLIQFATRASFNVARKWTQTVTEEHDLVISSPSSVSANTERPAYESYSFELEVDEGQYENTPPSDAAPGTFVIGSESLTGRTLANGDTVFDAAELLQGRADFDYALETVTDRAKTTIAKTHRANRVSVDIPLAWLPQLHDTANVTTLTLEAEGLIARIEETLSMATGQAVSSIEIAISRTSGLGLSDPPETSITPDVPDTDTSVPFDKPYLGTYIGGSVTSLAYNDTWSGFITNYEPPQGVGAPLDAAVPLIEKRSFYNADRLYDGPKFVINYPEISETDRQEIVATQPYDIISKIRNDLLTESVI